MKELIEINTMTARNVYSSESFRFVKMVVEKISNIEIPTKAKEIHKQNKPHDYTDEFRLYGTKEQGIEYHSYYKVLDDETNKLALFTISNETLGIDDFWVKFTISTQDGIKLEIESEKESILKKIKTLFEEEFGYCRKQSKEEVFDELIHEIRNRGTERNGEVGIALGLKAIEIESEDFWAQFYLGCSYGLNGQHEKAIEHLTKAIELDETSYDAYYNLSKSYLELGKFKQAKETIKKAKSLANNNHAITYYYALILEKLGEKKEAIEKYKEAIALAPEKIEPEKKVIISYLATAQEKLKKLQK